LDFQENENNTELLSIFEAESEEILECIFDELEGLIKNSADKELYASVYRNFHSLKGALGTVGFRNIQNLIHKIEDIFDTAKTDSIYLDNEKILFIIRACEQTSKYIQASVEEKREVIDNNITDFVSRLEFINDVELKDTSLNNAILTEESTDISVSESNTKMHGQQESINEIFNTIFELIDSIVPEEEAQEIILLREEVSTLYGIFEDTDLYEVKTSFQNVLTKLDFVMNASNTLTISEILEIRNDLSSAAAKFNTSCVETDSSGITFFDIAEKISMLHGSSVYAQEIKDDILHVKEKVDDQGVLEIISITIEILDFITENSVQLEEQMAQTIKSGIEYCASPNENIDCELIVQQLEIMRQLLDLNYKKDTGVTEAKNLSTQSSITGKSSASTEIKTLHVSAQKLDALVNQLGELIITKIKTEKNLEKIDSIKNINESCQKDLLKTSNYLRYYNRKYLQNKPDEQYISSFAKQTFVLLSDITQNISKTIYDLNILYRSSKEDDIKMRIIIDEMESMVKNIRVLPISTVFNSFSRMVRDIAAEKGKEIDFEIQGKDTCADKKIIEEIKTPLIHILRNAIDHGIEKREDRIRAGKDPAGRIILSAKQDDNKVVIDVIDDGQGFNLEKIKDRAVSRGFLTAEEVATMTDEAIMGIIFWPGFTTGDSITSVSGRGIGLDVVKTKLSQLNGKVKVLSEFGKGSCVHIEIPITLTTLRVFLVKVSGQTFAIPIQFITTFILKEQGEIKTNNGTQAIIYNDKIIPIYYLADILGLERTQRKDKEIILIIESEEKNIALVVDKLLGDQDILQKKLPPPLYKVQNISGITNLSSGESCLILNIQDILHTDFSTTLANIKPDKHLLKDTYSHKRILVVDDLITARTLLKNILSNAGFKVDLASDVSEANTHLQTNHYDLIITDLIMPDIDGYSYIEKIQADEMYHDIPVIAITMENIDAAKEKLSQSRIAAYFDKGNFEQKEFLDIVKKIIDEQDY